MLRLALAFTTAAFALLPATAQAHPHTRQCTGNADAFCYHFVPRAGQMVRVECEVFFAGYPHVNTEGCFHQ